MHLCDYSIMSPKFDWFWLSKCNPFLYIAGSNIHRNQSQQSKQMPTSISGYSICATQGDSVDEELNGDNSNEARNNNNYVQDQLTAFTNSARQHQKLRQSVIYSEKHDTTQFPLNQSQTTSTSGSNSRAGMATSASNYSMSSGINLMIIYVWFNYLPKLGIAICSFYIFFVMRKIVQICHTTTHLLQNVTKPS